MVTTDIYKESLDRGPREDYPLYTRYPIVARRAWPLGRVRARAKESCIQSINMPQYVNRTLQESITKNNSSRITLTVIGNHNMVEEIRVSIIIIKISNVNMYILCDLKGQCLNHNHVANVYEYIGAKRSKLRQPMRSCYC